MNAVPPKKGKKVTRRDIDLRLQMQPCLCPGGKLSLGEHNVTAPGHPSSGEEM